MIGREWIPRLCGVRSDPPRIVPFGKSTRRRELMASIVVMGAALPVGLLASSSLGRPPNLYVVLIAIGITGTAAWLIDGRRYVAPGTAALGVGIAFALGRHTTIDQYALAFGSIGAVLLLLSRVNPQAVAAAGGFLIYLASILGFHRANGTSPRPWLFPLIMFVWGGAHFVRLRQTKPLPIDGGTGPSASAQTDVSRVRPTNDGLVPAESAQPLA